MGERTVRQGLGCVGRMMDRLEGAFVFPRGRGRLMRPRSPRVVAGVCAGVAEYYGWDASLLRFVVVVLTVASSGLLAVGYAVAWVLVPEGVRALPERTGTAGS